MTAPQGPTDIRDFRIRCNWSDASLGCPKEGYAYVQVITLGYRLVFDLAGTSHMVHTNSNGSHVVLCEDGAVALRGTGSRRQVHAFKEE